MHHSLGDPLAVEVRHLVDEGDILEQQRSALSDAHRGGLLAHRLTVARGDDGASLLQHRGREWRSGWWRDCYCGGCEVGWLAGSCDSRFLATARFFTSRVVWMVLYLMFCLYFLIMSIVNVHDCIVDCM